MDQLKIKVSETDILKYLSLKQRNNSLSLITHVIKDYTQMTGMLIGRNFYFRNSRFTIEGIPETVIMKVEEIENTGKPEPFEMLLTCYDNCPF